MNFNKRDIKNFNLVYDSLYNIQSNSNSLLSSKINIFLEELNQEAKKWGYEFKLNQKTQKFKLYKIKNGK